MGGERERREKTVQYERIMARSPALHLIAYKVCFTPPIPQSRFRDKLLRIRVVCPQSGTALLKGLSSPEA